MTLSSFQSSHKAEYESLPTTEIVRRIREAMDEGCIRPSHVYDLVDEALDRLSDKEKRKPQRNCDLYYTADEAHEAHEKFRTDWIDGKYGYTGREPPWFGEWIMALATKKWGSKK